MNPTTYIQVITPLVGHDVGPYLECRLSDNAVWNCDMNGENWRRAYPNAEELMQKLRNHLDT